MSIRQDIEEELKVNERLLIKEEIKKRMYRIREKENEIKNLKRQIENIEKIIDGLEGGEYKANSNYTGLDGFDDVFS